MARTSFKILTKSICFNAIFSSFSIPTKPSKHLLSTFPFRISLFHPSLLPLQTCKTTRQFLQIHAHFIVSGLFQDPFAASRILKFVADSGDIAYTALIFQQMELPDTFSVNTIIKVYSQSSNPSRAVVFYFDMRQKGFFFPNSYTFPPLENSCAKEGCSDNGKKCHGQALKIGVDEDIHVRNALVHMYASCGLVGCARQVFDGMLQRDLVSWNSMVNGLSKRQESWFWVEAVSGNGEGWSEREHYHNGKCGDCLWSVR